MRLACCENNFQHQKIIERMTTSADNFTITALRNGRAQLPWYGDFDQFSYYDAAATQLSSHETTWGNFLIANYFHRLWSPAAAAGHDARFDYMEDDDLGDGTVLNTFSLAIRTGNSIALAQDSAETKSMNNHKPYAAVYYEINPSAASATRMLRVNLTATSGMSDLIVQIVRT
jgi:hypothetical protein